MNCRFIALSVRYLWCCLREAYWESELRRLEKLEERIRRRISSYEVS